MALILGMDPMAYLRAGGLEARVLSAVLDRAAEESSKRKQAEIEAIGAACARAVGRMFKR